MEHINNKVAPVDLFLKKQEEENQQESTTNLSCLVATFLVG
jgi:hypothetical protein